MTIVSLAGMAVLAACSRSTSSFGPPMVADGCRFGRGITAQAATRSYIVLLDIGPAEATYTQAQADSLHPGQGEVVLRGQPSVPPADGGAASAAGHHLAAHICSKAGGAVIQDADPMITLANDTSRSVAQQVPVAVMQRVDANAGDLNYGNNVVLVADAVYTVTISLNGETAILRVQAPPSTETGTTVSGHMSDMPAR